LVSFYFTPKIKGRLPRLSDRKPAKNRLFATFELGPEAFCSPENPNPRDFNPATFFFGFPGAFLFRDQRKMPKHFSWPSRILFGSGKERMLPQASMLPLHHSRHTKSKSAKNVNKTVKIITT